MLLLTLASLLTIVHASSLDLTNGQAIQSAAQKVIQNLLSLYTPNSDGVYDFNNPPWFASGMIWDMLYEYQRWTGDDQFANLATSALANVSYGKTADILNGDASTFEGLSGKWNDDIIWMSLAITSGAEMYGPEQTMPGVDAPWIAVPEKTLQEAYQQYDSACGGGIYWSRNRQSASANYKSSITNLEFIHNSARVYIQTKNQTVLDLAEKTWQWMFGASGLANSGTGTVFDGLATTNCNQHDETDWTYQYGQMIASGVFLYQATQQQSYLETAETFLTSSLAKFAPKGVITEGCETATTLCNKDQMEFKGSYMRSLSYLFRATSDQQVKSQIQTVLGSTIGTMVQYSCDNNWICSGNWTSQAAPVNQIPGLHAAASALVAALGVFTQQTGAQLYPTNLNFGAPQVNATSSTSGNSGRVVSAPLSSALSNTVSPVLLSICLLFVLHLTNSSIR